MDASDSPFSEPELPFHEDSEIEATVDVSIMGLDNIFRPVLINQDQELIQLTLEDAQRLHKFLGDAVKFIQEYNSRIVQ